MRDHRKLLIWRKAHDLAIAVRRATRRFPKRDYASIRNQANRASESVVFTIVEGCGTTSQREFARFLDMSLKSATELEEQLELAKDYGILPDRQWQALYSELIEIRKMTCGLRAKVIEAAEKEGRAPRRMKGDESADS